MRVIGLVGDGGKRSAVRRRTRDRCLAVLSAVASRGQPSVPEGLARLLLRPAVVLALACGQERARECDCRSQDGATRTSSGARPRPV